MKRREARVSPRPFWDNDGFRSQIEVLSAQKSKRRIREAKNILGCGIGAAG